MGRRAGSAATLLGAVLALATAALAPVA